MPVCLLFLMGISKLWKIPPNRPKPITLSTSASFEIRFHQNRRESTLLLCRVEDPSTAGANEDYGVLKFIHLEDPRPSQSTSVNVTVKFTASVFIYSSFHGKLFFPPPSFSSSTVCR